MKGKRTMLNSCGCCDNFVNRKIESSLSKLTARKEIEEGIDEVFSLDIFDASADPLIRSLFPSTKNILYYLQDDDAFVQVDGKFKTSIDNMHELLAYSNHTGSSYTDYDDLKEQYNTALRAAIGKSGFYLP